MARPYHSSPDRDGGSPVSHTRRLMSPWDAVTGSAHALPLDVLRVLVGVLCMAYFARTYREAATFMGPDGLIDHALLRRLLPFTRLSVFPERTSLRVLRAWFAVGCIASVLLAAGVSPQPVAVVLYVLAVSTYRWNLVLMYVDDAIIHLALLWMILLPIGRTLTLPALLADPSGSWEVWLDVSVPGLAVWCFLANLALVYLVAGLWKWTSPMWRGGSAVHAALRMAVAYTPDAWGASRAPLLRVANVFALLVEPALALLLVLPASSPVKAALLAGAVAFHGGIIATMRFPFANLVMLGALVVFFGPELMETLGAPPPTGGLGPAPNDWIALAVVTCLALLFLLNATIYRDGHPPTIWRGRGYAPGMPRLNPMYVPLWAIGLAQSYRLFDWIDVRNYRVTYSVVETARGRPDREVDAEVFFPRSMRHILAQSYLYGNLWVRIDPRSLSEVRARLLTGYARRHCEAYPGTGEDVIVDAIVHRLTPDNLDLHRGTRIRLMRFTNEAGSPRMREMCLTPPAFG